MKRTSSYSNFNNNMEKKSSGVNIQLNIKEILLILGLLGHAFNSYLAHQRQELLFNEIVGIKNDLIKQLPAIRNDVQESIKNLDLGSKIPELKKGIKELMQLDSKKNKVDDESSTLVSEIVMDKIVPLSKKEEVVSITSPDAIISPKVSILDTANETVFHPFILKIVGISIICFTIYYCSSNITNWVSSVSNPVGMTARDATLKDHTVKDIVTGTPTNTTTNVVGSTTPAVDSTVSSLSNVPTLVDTSTLSEVVENYTTGFLGLPDCSELLKDTVSSFKDVLD